MGNQEIQLDDIVVDIENNIIGKVSHIGSAFNFKGTLQFPKNDDPQINRHCTFNCHKVIATTDPSLNLPLIHQSFIEEYVEKQGKINELMINLIDVGGEEWMGDDYTGEPYWNEILKVEVNKDNEVIIHPVKESWTREEILSFIGKMQANNIIKSMVLADDFNEWITKNL
ncbi:hypothetical protein M0P65_06700 [Candidatus Gracilibacteria bacterium]|nr:hypothetical protein [Candidatus Gracilibacteria bacterium]